MPTVVLATPQTVSVPQNTKKVAIAVAASGGVINVTYRINEDGDAIDVPWDVGEVANLATDSAVIDWPITSVTITGDGTYNVSFYVE